MDGSRVHDVGAAGPLCWSDCPFGTTAVGPTCVKVGAAFGVPNAVRGSSDIAECTVLDINGQTYFDSDHVAPNDMQCGRGEVGGPVSFSSCDLQAWLS